MATWGFMSVKPKGGNAYTCMGDATVSLTKSKGHQRLEFKLASREGEGTFWITGADPIGEMLASIIAKYGDELDELRQKLASIK